MADLNDSAAWPGIRQIETTDPVVGGAPNPDTGEGTSNIPALQLAQRSALLRVMVEKGDVFAAAGGSADAITLTTGLDLDDIARGFTLRFRATAENTGPATVAVDGVGAIALQTVTGAALPAGYIRSDADTRIVFDGNAWTADRETEVGENANGRYVAYASGVMIARTDLDINTDTEGTRYTWVFPVAFAVRPNVVGTLTRVYEPGVGNGSAYVTGDTSGTIGDFLSTSSTQVSLKIQQTSGDMTRAEGSLMAIGDWY